MLGGVSVLINKSFPSVNENIYADSQGKYVIMVFALWQQNYVIAAIYFPPPFSPEIQNAILDRISKHCPSKLLRPRPPKQHLMELYNWAQVAGVIIVWRWKNQKNKKSIFMLFYLL